MRRLVYFVLFVGLGLITPFANAQCPILNDGFGSPDPNPYFVSCSGGDYTIFIQSDDTIGTYTIDWGDGSATTSGTGIIPPNYVSHTYAATIDTFVVTLTTTNPSCTVTGTVVMEEPVNASIQIPIGGVTQICAPGDIEFVNSSTDVSPTTTFTWDFGDGTPPITFDYSNLGDTLTHTFQKNTVSCETAVTLTAENYCSFGSPTTAQFYPIQVWDVDTAAINASAILLCYPDTIVHFENSTIKNCLQEGNVSQRYEYWNFGDYWGKGYDSIINWQPFDPPARPGHTIAYPGIGSYDVMLIDSNFCGRDTAVLTIQIVEQPIANLAISDDTICAGETVIFYNQSTQGANNFYWSFNNNGNYVNTGFGNQYQTYNTTGNYSVELVANISGGSASCYDTAYGNVYVQPSPVADFNLSPTIGCDSMEVSITENTQNALTWEWDFDNGNTSILQNPTNQFYNGVGVYTIELKVEHANTCRDSITKQVEIKQSPVAAFTPYNFCQNSNATFTDLSSHYPGDPITQWSWDFGDGSNASLQNPTHTYANSTAYTIELIVNTAYCADTTSMNITVPPKPVADFLTSTTSGCEPLVVNFTDQSSGASTYNWNFSGGNTSNQQNPSYTFTNGTLNDTVYQVELIVETQFGCTDTMTENITVFGNAIADFTQNATPQCAPLAVNFNDASQGAISWQWDFGDSTGSSLQNPNHVFNNNTLFITNYNVELVATSPNGCTDTTSQIITVYPEPDFPFNTNPDSGCSPLTVSFPALVGAVQYQWDFGDGTTTTGQAPTHVFVNNTTNNQVFTVELIATSAFGCSDTSYRDVVVFPNPDALFTLNNNIGCPELEVSFANNSMGASFYQWDFGDGSNDTTGLPQFTHTYDNLSQQQINFDVSLLVSTPEGCTDTANQIVTLYPRVIADFTSDTGGCSPVSIAFNNTSLAANTYYWNFGNGFASTSQNPNQTFIYNGINDTTYSVLLAAESNYGCTDTTEYPIVVFNTAIATLNLSSLQGCTPITIDLQNNSYGADSYFWDFDDGTIDSAGIGTLSHSYVNATSSPEDYNIVLIAETVEGCNDTTTQTLTVFPDVIANFSGAIDGCSPLTLQFSNQSTGASSYMWDFGTGINSTSTTPSQTFYNLSIPDTNYTIEMIASSQYGCADTTSQSITVYNTPVANLSIDQQAGCSPITVNLTNSSSGADGYTWDFDDGQTSSTLQTSLTHSYTNTGSTPLNINIQLVAGTIEGCNDTTYQALTVYPEVIAGFTTDTVGCSPHTVTFNDQSVGANTYNWDFGNGLTAVTQNPSQTFINNGIPDTNYFVTLVTSSQYGCTDTVTTTITVHNTPNTTLALSQTQACTPAEVDLINTTTGADSYFWDFDDGTTSTSNAGTIHRSYTNTTSSPVDFSIMLIGETAEGCNDTSIQTLTVFPPVVAAFDADTIGCSQLEVDFDNQSTGAVAYYWNFGNGNNSVATSPHETFTYSGNQDTTYTISLVATSIYSCSDTAYTTITVLPDANALFTATPALQTYPDTSVAINNLTVGQWNSTWNFGDGITSTISGITEHEYTTWGEFDIQLVIDNGYCNDTAVQTIVIMPPPPTADFLGGGEGCEPLTVSFTNLSEYGESYFWDFGDGNTSESFNPTYTYMVPGTYSVELVVIGMNGQATVYKDEIVVVHPNAEAYFDFRPSNVQIPRQSVQFLNLSNNATIFDWSFGDGGTSEEESPQYQYTTIGEYYVTLRVDNEWGCADSFTSNIPITAETGGKISYPNVFTPDPSGPSGGYYGDYNLDNYIFYPVSEGVVEYHLMIYNRWGELIFETFDIEQGWDGYYRGELCQQDVYVFKAEAVFSNGDTDTVVGDLTLLR